MIGAILRVLVVGLVLLVGAMFMFPDAQRPLPMPTTATMLSNPMPLPPVALTDKAGLDFSTADLRDRFSLVFFGFTFCPDICPITLNVLASLRSDWNAPNIAPPEVLFVSVDPERDDPDRIREYLENFDSDFQGVTGQRDAMQPWLDTLGVTVHIQKLSGGQSYNVTHNSTVYAVGPGAEFLAVFSAPHDAATIAADLLKIRQHYLRDHASQPDPSAAL